MTATPIVESPDGGDSLFCYRHPARETWVRCGRCDRPICTGCAMQGPVGLRCKQCGKPAFDPLTSFTPTQLVLGIGTSLLAGLAAGFIAARIGFFSIIVAYFAGGFIAEFVARVTGYKRGPVMLAILVGGILVGSVLGAIGAFFIDYGLLLSFDEDGNPIPLEPFIADAATWALASAAAACVGAWQKVR